MKKVLMIALEFPPCQSAGVLRTASFVRHLPAHGWLPIVLTASTRAYTQIDESLKPVWPTGVEIARAFALDSSRHLAIRGRYWAATATPDRYVSWLLPAVVRGLRLIRRHPPDVIWSTYPVATTHWIARILARRTGIPWVADFRDPAPHLYDAEQPVSGRAIAIDRATARDAVALVFTTDRARDLYLRSYPAREAATTHVIPNGFDEGLLGSEEGAARARAGGEDILLLHSGTLYGSGRKPDTLIHAVAMAGKKLAARGLRLTLRFRGAKPTPAHERVIREADAEAYVEFAPRTPFQEAAREMLGATALVLLQSEVFDHQIPGKAYEYIATRRPILAVTGPQGATAGLLRQVESTVVVDGGDVAAVAAGLERLIDLPARTEDIGRFARSAGASLLSNVLSEIASTAPALHARAVQGGAAQE